MSAHGDKQYYHNLSLKLSEVFDDIGVNEDLIKLTRRASLWNDCLSTIVHKIDGRKESIVHTGSRCEGSTTPGLWSDFDQLLCLDYHKVIQDWADWELGLENLLFIQDETTAPGYCMLQLLRPDVPLPDDGRGTQHTYIDRRGRALLKNTLMHHYVAQRFTRNGPSQTEYGENIVIHSNEKPRFTRNGPAITDNILGQTSTDYVLALPCNSWPPEGTDWLNRPTNGDWPSEELKRQCGATGFCVVPVASRDSEIEETEWRISTSMAEKLLMFSLNITQLRCYVLMKMILKTFINPYFEEGTISSFMCKSVIFFCVATTKSDMWQENNLLSCLTFVLNMLRNTIQCVNCPHFILQQNNLMRGKVSYVTKMQLLEKIDDLLKSQGEALLPIQIDDLGKKLQTKLNVILNNAFQNLSSYNNPSTGRLFSIFSVWIPAWRISLYYLGLLHSADTGLDNIIKAVGIYIFRLVYYSALDNYLIRSVCSLLMPLLCTTFGSILASNGIRLYKTIPPASLIWFSFGVNSDTLSGRLKLASVFYCTGEVGITAAILNEIQQTINLEAVEPVCCCATFHNIIHLEYFKEEFIRSSSEGYEDKIKDLCAYCIKFLPYEMNCVPFELQYEMFRSIREDLPHRDREATSWWMDWAVVDSLPYLYFLQYKTYNRLQCCEARQKAFDNLIREANTLRNLGHRETTWNLIGQCMEEGNRPQEALHCYTTSLNIRARNNAAQWHICKLLSRLVNSRLH